MPSDLTPSEWLTLILVNLVNEIDYLSYIQF